MPNMIRQTAQYRRITLNNTRFIWKAVCRTVLADAVATGRLDPKKITPYTSTSRVGRTALLASRLFSKFYSYDFFFIL